MNAEFTTCPHGGTVHDIHDHDDIERLVRDFYRAVAIDDRLGPIFAAAKVDWSVHIPKLCDFWAWQLFGGPRSVDRPLRAHEPINRRTPFAREHYHRWFELFSETVDESFAGPIANLAKNRASKMIGALRLLMEESSAPPKDPRPVQVQPSVEFTTDRPSDRTNSGQAFIERTNTIVYCKHWAENVSFYRTQIGLAVNFENDWFVEFCLGRTSFLSVADSSRSTIDDVAGQGIALTWRVDDLDTVRDTLHARGVTLTPVSTRWGARVFYCHDPEGHRIEFWAESEPT